MPKPNELGERITSLEANGEWIRSGMKSLEDKLTGFTNEFHKLESSLKVMFNEAKDGFLKQHNQEMKRFHIRLRIVELVAILIVLSDFYLLVGALLDDKKALRLQELARGAIYKEQPQLTP